MSEIALQQFSTKSLPSARRRRIIKKIALYTLMTAIAVIMMFPFWYALVTSSRIRPATVYNPVRFWPEQFTRINYSIFADILNTTLQISVARVLYNTAFITFGIIILQLFFCSIGAYSMARLEWKGKRVVLKIFFASMMVPGIVTMIPSFELLRSFGLIDTRWGLIIPGAVSIFGVIFLRAFFLSTPKEIAEAGRIDGAGEFRIFATLYMRMILPGVITLGLFAFNGNWNAFMWPMIVLGHNRSHHTLAIVINEFNTLASVELFGPGPAMAAAVVTIVPTVVLFLIGQKFFMDNLAFTGIK